MNTFSFVASSKWDHEYPNTGHRVSGLGITELQASHHNW